MFHNLLPTPALSRARTHFLLRSIEVAVWGAAAVAAVGAAAAFPAYLSTSADLEEARRVLENALPQGHQSLLAQARSLRGDLMAAAMVYEANRRNEQLVENVRLILDQSPDGIDLQALILSPPPSSATPVQQQGMFQGTITGKATDRDRLRAFEDALTSLPTVAEVHIPVSAYARRAQIPFTATFMLRLTASSTPPPSEGGAAEPHVP